jgi:hypothetical protein
MNAERARQASIKRGLHRGDRLSDGVEIVADQRRQETRGAESPVRRAYRTDRLETGIIVEQHTAAAVDLHVDETGQQNVSLEIDDDGAAGSRIRRSHHAIDAPLREQDRVTAHDSLAGQNPAMQ